MEGFRSTDHAKILSCLNDDVIWEMPGFFYHEGKKAFDKEIESPNADGHPNISIVRVVEEVEKAGVGSERHRLAGAAGAGEVGPGDAHPEARRVARAAGEAERVGVGDAWAAADVVVVDRHSRGRRAPDRRAAGRRHGDPP